MGESKERKCTILSLPHELLLDIFVRCTTPGQYDYRRTSKQVAAAGLDIMLSTKGPHKVPTRLTYSFTHASLAKLEAVSSIPGFAERVTDLDCTISTWYYATGRDDFFLHLLGYDEEITALMYDWMPDTMMRTYWEQSLISVDQHVVGRLAKILSKLRHLRTVSYFHVEDKDDIEREPDFEVDAEFDAISVSALSPSEALARMSCPCTGFLQIMEAMSAMQGSIQIDKIVLNNIPDNLHTGHQNGLKDFYDVASRVRSIELVDTSRKGPVLTKSKRCSCEDEHPALLAWTRLFQRLSQGVKSLKLTLDQVVLSPGFRHHDLQSLICQTKWSKLELVHFKHVAFDEEELLTFLMTHGRQLTDLMMHKCDSIKPYAFHGEPAAPLVIDERAPYAGDWSRIFYLLKDMRSGLKLRVLDLELSHLAATSMSGARLDELWRLLKEFVDVGIESLDLEDRARGYFKTSIPYWY